MMSRLHTILMGLVLGLTSASAQVPEVRLHNPDSEATVGRPHTVEFEVSWTGSPTTFIVSPPVIPEFTGGTLRLGKAYGESDGDVHRIVQSVYVVGDTPGTLTIPPLEIPYQDTSVPPPPPSEDGTEEAPEASTVVFTEVVKISISKPTPWGIILGTSGTLALVAGIASVALYGRRRREISPPESVPNGLTAAREALHAAKKYRLDGDYYRFFGALRNGAQVFGKSPEGSQLLASLEKQTNDAGYRGGRPTDEQMDGAIRDYQRVMAAQAPSSGNQARVAK